MTENVEYITVRVTTKNSLSAGTKEYVCPLVVNYCSFNNFYLK